ncbi:hypothetical protein TNCV_1576901 [Trichonephila clavipes]|nr:hypothetical protein TNCV_1576901 [Trichonephila clavipes]
MPLRHVGTLNSRRAASPLMRLVKEEVDERPLTTFRVFTLKIRWNRAKSHTLSHVWCSKLLITTGVHLVCDEFHGPRSDRSPVAEWLVHRASTPQVRDSNPGLSKVDSAFHPFSGWIKIAWELNTGGFVSDWPPERNI